jgi:hypothetical protein
MPDTAERPADHPAPPAADHPPRLTVRYEPNPDGWVTAQIVELPAAISQGRDENEAWVNVFDALHDLTHKRTASERVANAVQARVIEPLLGLLRR